MPNKGTIWECINSEGEPQESKSETFYKKSILKGVTCWQNYLCKLGYMMNIIYKLYELNVQLQDFEKDIIYIYIYTQ